MHHSRHSAGLLYEKLMKMHQHAFMARRFDVAYHLLAAALHAAEEAQDQDRVIEVEILAKERQAAIDREQRNTATSSLPVTRGVATRFTLLAATAAAMRADSMAVESEGGTQESRRKVGDGGHTFSTGA
jgi:hypothetical protein